MKTAEKKFFRFFIIIGMFFLFTSLGQAQSLSPDPFNLCNQNERTEFSSEIMSGNDAVTISGIDLPVIPGETVILHGQNFDKLPFYGTKIRLQFIKSNDCPWDSSQGIPPVYIHYLDPQVQQREWDFAPYAFEEQKIQFELPQTIDGETVIIGAGILVPDPSEDDPTRTRIIPKKYSNISGYVTNIDIIYQYPDACSQSFEILGGLQLGYPNNFCELPSEVFVYPPFNLAITSSSPTQIALHWDYHRQAYLNIDGFKVYMHWCQSQYENCDQIEPRDYKIGDTKTGPGGTSLPFWIELMKPDGRPMESNNAQRDVTIGPNNSPQADPTNWSDSIIFIAVTAFDSNDGESLPAVIKLVIP